MSIQEVCDLDLTKLHSTELCSLVFKLKRPRSQVERKKLAKVLQELESRPKQRLSSKRFAIIMSALNRMEKYDETVRWFERARACRGARHVDVYASAVIAYGLIIIDFFVGLYALALMFTYDL